MKQKANIGAIVCQTCILIIFLSGMFLNYFLLGPVIDYAETERLENDIRTYFNYFYPKNGYDPHQKSKTDSIMALNLDPYGVGFLMIMDSSANIIYSQGGETGDGRQFISKNFGELAVKLLNREYSDLDMGYCNSEYNFTAHTSLYANYLPLKGIMYYYAVDYWEISDSIMNKYLILLLMTSLGSIIIIMAAFYFYKKIMLNEHKVIAVQQELDTASEIQQSMLPKGENNLMQIDLNAVLVPAQKVSGDLYTYIIRDGLLYFCIGDVSGKGIPASLFMSKIVTLFHSCTNYQKSPAKIADNINKELCNGNEQNMFMTGVLGAICLADGRVTYVNAGHELPIIWNGKKESKLQFLKSDNNIPFGIISDAEYTENLYQIEDNGIIVLYTDGVSEAKSQHGKYFGRDAVLSVLEQYKSLGAKEINSQLIKNIVSFESGITQSDDITLLTFRKATMTKHAKHLMLRNRISDLRQIAQFTEDIFNEFPFDDRTRILIRTGLDEALTNCVLYAYDTPDQEIDVQATIENHQLIFTIKDRGKEFNPLTYTPAPPSEFKEGGMGIFIYKSNFDEVLYRRENGYNELKLSKKI